MSRLGLLGGTFDPVHCGHLHIADAARKALNLTQVVFAPNKAPVHKPGRTVSPAEDRFRMVQLAVEHNPAYAVSRVEIDREGPSFATDTLHSFQSQADELFWIAGADTVPLLPTWHAPHELARLCTFACVTRPGYTRPVVPAGFRVEWVDAPGVDVSASDVRARVQAGQSIQGLVPDAVAAYIVAHGLYQSRA